MRQLLLRAFLPRVHVHQDINVPLAVLRFWTGHVPKRVVVWRDVGGRWLVVEGLEAVFLFAVTPSMLVLPVEVMSLAPNLSHHPTLDTVLDNI